MKRETHEVAEKTLDEITESLKDETLTEEERQKMEKHAARLAGVILSPWIPFGWSRRLIMAGTGLSGVALRASRDKSAPCLA